MTASRPILPKQDIDLDALIERLVESYQSDDRTHHLDATFLPSQARTIEILGLLRQLIFPGFFDEERLSTQTVRFHVGDLLMRLRDMLYEQIRQALRYEENRQGAGQGDLCEHCDKAAAQLTGRFLERIPELRRILALDVQAAFDGDPAAVSTDETIFCYPGLYAVFVHRVAHELYRMNAPLLSRIMAEHAHSKTGADIHPGAAIGESFFIDHATGVVIGETSDIGDHVQIYQGVTLGALAPKNADQQRGRKRHPTIEDHVTIYPGATVLGGETIVGARSTINGSVFLTQSVPPDHTVRVKHPEPQLRAKRTRRPDAQSSDADDAST